MDGRTVVVWFAGLLVLAGCRTAAPWQEFVQDADFTHYRTYRLIVSEAEGAGRSLLPPGLGDLSPATVGQRLGAQLAEKGFQSAADGVEPDFYVAAWWESHPIHHWDADLYEEKLMERNPGLERLAWRFRVEVMDGRTGEVFWIHESDPLAETRWTGFELLRAVEASLDRFPTANREG